MLDLVMAAHEQLSVLTLRTKKGFVPSATLSLWSLQLAKAWGVGIMTRKWIGPLGPLDHACLPRGDPPLNMRRLWQELLVATLPPTPLDMQGNHIYSCHEYVNLNYRFMQYR